MIDAMLADDRHSWQLGPDAAWRRTEHIEGRPGTIDVFETLKEAALVAVLGAVEPHRPATSVGLARPACLTATEDDEHRATDRGRAEVPVAGSRARRATSSQPTWSAHSARPAQRRRSSSRTSTSTRVTGRWRGPASPRGLRHTRSTLIVSLKALTRRGQRIDPAARRARGTGDADAHSRRVAAVARSLARARAVRRRAARGAAHDPSAPAQATARVSGVAIVELSLDEVDVLLRAEVVDRFVELEAELVAGTESDLEPLREVLDREPGLDGVPRAPSSRRPSTRSSGTPVDPIRGSRRPPASLRARRWPSAAGPAGCQPAPTGPGRHRRIATADEMEESMQNPAPMADADALDADLRSGGGGRGRAPRPAAR